ncbi:hypothetical protein CI15_32760 [Paraburkholderia monticola]|uniref:Uncharacterized protein n=1 Tax=Paraburkholderia monticola TaxID=1399968 RepID=A0A149PBD2_9BURK|nr:hypothetical protein [Paraburkholderia monticola]KXU82323.1 hypothetical protein CI15_32760 [Paraburkholderia monticola]
MEGAAFIAATRQLVAAAEILAKAGPPDWRSDSSELLAFFRRHERTCLGLDAVETSDDDLFARTSHAALTMAGRNEFAASHALLKQARSLLTAT